MKNAKTSAPTPNPMEIIVFFVLADGIVNELLLRSLSQVASTCQGQSKRLNTACRQSVRWFKLTSGKSSFWSIRI